MVDDRRFDLSCIVAFALLYISNILEYVQRVKRMSGNQRFGYGTSSSSNSSGGNASRWSNWNNPTHIEETFAKRSESRLFDDATSMLSAISLFSLYVPIFQVCWLLSRGGKRRIINHIPIFVLALASGLCELLSSLMLTGTRSMASFLSRDFELSNWGISVDNGSDVDGIGWRVLEMAYMMNRGLTVWVNAFEWLCLFGIFALLFVDVLAEHKTLKEGAVSLSKQWATLGLIIGFLGWFEFVSDILRTTNWRVYSSISHVIVIVNLWVLLPAWLIMLGMKLPKMRDKFEDREDEIELVEETTRLAPDTVVFD